VKLGEGTGAACLVHQDPGDQQVRTQLAPTTGTAPVFCAHCAIGLQPGTGTSYRITIEAVADPAPPVISARDLATDLRQQIQQLMAQLQGISEQEAMDQVYRRLMFYLCGPCYRRWIENPTGKSHEETK
jgi:hypothetical protein